MLGSAHADEGQPADWAAMGLQGKTLELVDRERVEEYRFGDEGAVTATIGQRQGPLAGPVFYWRIDGAALIISQERGKQAFVALEEPRVRGDLVSVKRKAGGQIESLQYRLVR